MDKLLIPKTYDQACEFFKLASQISASFGVPPQSSSIVDPMEDCTESQKAVAFEWLRSVSLGETEDADKAACLMYENSRLITTVKTLAMQIARDQETIGQLHADLAKLDCPIA